MWSWPCANSPAAFTSTGSGDMEHPSMRTHKGSTAGTMAHAPRLSPGCRSAQTPHAPLAYASSSLTLARASSSPRASRVRAGASRMPRAGPSQRRDGASPSLASLRARGAALATGWCCCPPPGGMLVGASAPVARPQSSGSAAAARPLGASMVVLPPPPPPPLPPPSPLPALASKRQPLASKQQIQLRLLPRLLPLQPECSAKVALDVDVDEAREALSCLTRVLISPHLDEALTFVILGNPERTLIEVVAYRYP